MKITTSTMIILLLVAIISFSGCIKNDTYNSTWGEKNISLNAIKITDNTTGNRTQSNSSKYYVDGYVVNENMEDAFDVKIKVTTYDSNGNIFAVNDTPYLESNNIPARQMTRLYARFKDPDKKIVKFKVEVIDAKAQYSF